MYSIKLKSPFFTTNLHVRKSIVQQNIIELTAFIFSPDHKQLNYFQKEEIRLLKKKEVDLLHHIESEIKKTEQLAFRFGLPLL